MRTPIRGWTRGCRRLRRRHARRWVGALALCILTLPVLPASAARIPIERLSGAGTVVLDLPPGATASLPDSASTTAASDAFAASRARTQTRLDEVATQATTDTAQQSSLAKCFAAARETAVQTWLTSAVTGVPVDFNALVNEGAQSCFTSQFGPAVGTAVDTYNTYAEVVAGQANEVAYDAVSEADSGTDPTSPVPPPSPATGGGGSDDGESTDGGTDGFLIVLLLAIAGGGLYAVYLRGRRRS